MMCVAYQATHAQDASAILPDLANVSLSAADADVIEVPLRVHDTWVDSLVAVPFGASLLILLVNITYQLFHRPTPETKATLGPIAGDRVLTTAALHAFELAEDLKNAFRSPAGHPLSALDVYPRSA